MIPVRQANLLVVGLAFEKGSDVAITPPSGWTLIRRTNQSSNVGYATYRKVAGASEGASYAFALTNSPKWSIGGCAIAGADATTPVDVHNGGSGSSGNPSAPSVTTTGQSRKGAFLGGHARSQGEFAEALAGGLGGLIPSAAIEPLAYGLGC